MSSPITSGAEPVANRGYTQLAVQEKNTPFDISFALTNIPVTLISNSLVTYSLTPAETITMFSTERPKKVIQGNLINLITDKAVILKLEKPIVISESEVDKYVNSKRKIYIAQQKARLGIEKYINSNYDLYKIEGNRHSYTRTIGVGSDMVNTAEKIILPLNSCAVYLVKGGKYYLFSLLEKEPNFGVVSVIIEALFHTRESGRIVAGQMQRTEEGYEEIDLLSGTLKDYQKTLNVPLREGYKKLFDKVVLQHNLTEKIGYRVI